MSTFRVLYRTVNEISEDPTASFEIEMDLTPVTLPPCPDPTPSGFYPPIAPSQQPLVGNPITPADGVTYYYRAGMVPPVVPTPGYDNAVHFPAEPPPYYYTRDDLSMPGGVVDFFTAGLTNTVRLIIVGDGTLTMHFTWSGYPDSVHSAGCSIYVDRDIPLPGDNASPVFSQVPLVDDSFAVELAGSASGVCTHIIDIETQGGHFFGWGGTTWLLA